MNGILDTQAKDEIGLLHDEERLLDFCLDDEAEDMGFVDPGAYWELALGGDFEDLWI